MLCEEPGGDCESYKRYEVMNTTTLYKANHFLFVYLDSWCQKRIQTLQTHNSNLIELILPELRAHNFRL
jgi:hypothetical protein